MSTDREYEVPLDHAAIDSVATLAQEAIRGELDVKNALTTAVIDGVTYGTRQLVDLRAKLPEPALLKLSTLSALVAYVKANRDELDLSKSIIHVEGPTTVSLRGPLEGTFKQRLTYAQAVAPNRLKAAGESFKFGQWMSHPDMMMALQTLFVPESTNALLQLIRVIKLNTTVTSTDGGRGQSVQVQKGIDMVEEMNIPNPVQLAPFRTFSEIEQPVGPFVLRARSTGAGELAKLELSLTEADGGAWAEEATRRIVTYLEASLNPSDVEESSNPSTKIAIIG